MATIIHQRLRSERFLRESEGRFRATFEQAAVGIAHVAPDGGLLRVNERLCQIIGYSREELLQRTFQDITHPDDLDMDLACVRQLLAGEIDRYAMEKRYFRKDGSIVWIRLTVSLVRAMDGTPEHFISVVEDIAERKRTEEALRQSEETFRKLFEDSSDAILLIDSTGVFVECNQAALDLLKMTREQFLLLPPVRISPKFQPNGRGSEDAALEMIALAYSKGLHRFDWTCVNAEGGEFIVEVSLMPVTINGQVMLHTTWRDLTERKHLEEQLLQREKMDAIGQLAGGIAHDFNNQLGGILGFAELLQKRLEDATLRRYAENIMQASCRAADLTAQLLAFSRKGKYLSVPTDMHKVLAEVVELLRRSIDKRIEIKQHLEATPCSVLGDPTQLQNAVFNLALNARDAMPQGGVLTFSTCVLTQEAGRPGEELAAGRYLELCVTDTGTGMDAETKKRLFEPFFTTKEVGKGTGLGLASVYGTVKNHLGVVRVYSEPGRGSSFHLYLPVYEDPAVLPVPANAALPVSGHGRILIVDDEPIILALGGDVLRDLGYDVSTCGDPEEALLLYRREWQRIDLVLLDMVMPKLSGRDLFLAMKQVNPQVHALLSSGYSLNGEAQSILDLGVMAFVQKPFDQAELSQKVAEALRESL